MPVVSVAVRADEQTSVEMYIESGLVLWYQFCKIWKAALAPAFSHFGETIYLHHALPHLGCHLTRRGEGERGSLKGGRRG